jgi:HSP20 family protein
MRSRVQAVAIPSEIGDFTDEVRRVFLELGRVFGADSLAGECAPAVDVYETDGTVELVVDLPGIDASGVRLLAKGDSILIAGEKSARRVRGESTFHLVERGYGRFARVVRLGRACDMSKAQARFSDGELQISVPKIADRRGRAIEISIRNPQSDIRNPQSAIRNTQ